MTGDEQVEISGEFTLRQIPMHYVLKAKEVAASVERVLLSLNLRLDRATSSAASPGRTCRVILGY